MKRVKFLPFIGFLFMVFDIINALSISMSTRGPAVIAGATGYIGKSVVRESIRQGYKTFALVRDKKKVESAQGNKLYGEFFEGAQVIEVDVSDPIALEKTLQSIRDEAGDIESVISCLASRSGIKKEAYEIDYQATLNCIEAGIATNARHFVLLSAFCVRKPLLQFQNAKLKLEAALQSQSEITYSIVRPTAYFKSLSGQLERLQKGDPFLMFQDSTRANPIAESDLTTYMVDCISNENRHNKVLNLGGPDKALTKLEQGEMLFKAVGKEPKYSRIPVSIFDVSISLFQWLADTFQNEQLENAAELGRIGRYYAVEDMVTTEPEEMYGTISLQEHFDRIAQEGQEYDPYTTMEGILGLMRKDDADMSKTDTYLQPQESNSTSATSVRVPV